MREPVRRSLVSIGCSNSSRSACNITAAFSHAASSQGGKRLTESMVVSQSAVGTRCSGAIFLASSAGAAFLLVATFSP